MKQLNQKNVDIVAQAQSGARRLKFLSSVAILNESLAQGAWTLRGSVKANSGFYQGLLAQSYDHESSYGSKYSNDESSLSMCLCFGRPYLGNGRLGTVHNLFLSHAYRRLDGDKRNRKLEKLPLSLVQAWVELCAEKAAAFVELNNARPKPVITAIGLSPKVTKTLKEMNLDIDLPSIKMAKIVEHKIETVNNETGKKETITFYVVEWSKGIKHGYSRFAGRGNCHACGKSIPSGRFVPIEAKDNKSGDLCSFWIGCDCSRNIFGIKDIGVEMKHQKVKA